MKRISLEALLRTMQDQSYQEQYEYIRKLLEEEKIKPVKASRAQWEKACTLSGILDSGREEGLQRVYRGNKI